MNKRPARSLKPHMDNYTDISFEDEQYFAGLDDDQKPNGDVRVYGTWHFTYLGNSQRGALKYYTVLFFNEEIRKLLHKRKSLGTHWL